jgi:indolepyruvate ferredoxin oxidoreductase
MTTAVAPISIEDRYVLEEGTAVLTGVQALARLPMDQRRADRRAGLDTAGFVSGYEGSPLGGYDLELARYATLLTDLGIVFSPGLNEEMAATAVMGSQQAYRQPGARHQGVVGLWYGKAPGLDRAADAIRHANLMGVHRLGGALACVGDDASAKSSTVPSSSEMSLMDLMLPILVPAYPREILQLGLHGYGLSRAAGVWVGMKIATTVADGFETVTFPLADPAPQLPDLVVDGKPYRHEVSGHMLGDRLLALERSLVGPRLEIARRYAVVNRLNPTIGHGDTDRLGIVATGKTWRDLLEALDRLGLDERGRAEQGIRLIKLGMPFPLDAGTAREFARGLTEIIVVEEKRAFIELLLKDALYGMRDAPAIVGKRDEAGQPLFRASAELDPDMVARVIGQRLLARGEVRSVRDRVERLDSDSSVPAQVPVVRTPYFCSGCPHSTSTKVPAGATVAAGIGCHGLALLMHEPQVGNVIGITQMGGEGAAWIGMSPFVSSPHLIQNVGDGTFHHSGSLGVRAAVAAGVNITFKILFNSAVAMTGGQDIVGGRSVPELTRLLATEGVVRTIVTTDDPTRYAGISLAPNAAVRPRSRIVEAQQELARLSGVTALIHDQECATELRRKRKRGQIATPLTRVFINERVCEGCGDCGVKSNCLSVHPVETEFGRKTRIHQASCNLDMSCLQGDCPSFLVVTPATKRPRQAGSEVAAEDLPAPVARTSAGGFGMRIAGIGGTGVVTAAQVLAMAARIDGHHVAGLDQTGMAQKYGAVVSDLRIGSSSIDGVNRLPPGSCDLYLACDLVAACDPANLAVLDPDRSTAVISTGVTPTADQVVSADARATDVEDLAAAIEWRAGAGRSVRVQSQAISLRLFGNDQFATMIMLGAAYQTGALPITIDAIEAAIALNGVAVQANVQALRRGRQAVSDPAGLERALAAAGSPRPSRTVTRSEQRLIDAVDTAPGSELRRLLEVRVPDLVAYQHLTYARRYAEFVARVRAAEERCTGEADGPLAQAVARYLYKLMAYKDEYEVARLHLDAAVEAGLADEFGPGAQYAWQLHPPLLRALGFGKLTVGTWFRPGFEALHRMRRLRGTSLDPFGRTAVRRIERELVREYETTLGQVISGLTIENHEIAVEIAELPDVVRGYEDIKLAHVTRYRDALADAMGRFTAANRAGAAPATQLAQWRS